MARLNIFSWASIRFDALSVLSNKIKGGITTSAQPIRIVIIDPFAMVRKGLHLIIEQQPNMQVVAEAGDATTGLELVSREKPDIILIKLNPAGDPGMEVISQLARIWRQGRIILMTTNDDFQVCLEAVHEGVLGVVSKTQSPEILIKAIEKVYAGEVWIERSRMAQILMSMNKPHGLYQDNLEVERIKELSDREREVINLIGRGLKNQQIASQLCISTSTVRHHLTSIFNKLGVSDRLELLVFAHRNGLASSPK